MKTLKPWIVATALIVAGGFSSQIMAIRAIQTVSGEITAAPTPSLIEVGHMAYHIQANSPAQKAARSFFLGQLVDLVLTPVSGGQLEVVSIAAHTGP